MGAYMGLYGPSPDSAQTCLWSEAVFSYVFSPCPSAFYDWLPFSYDVRCRLQNLFTAWSKAPPNSHRPLDMCIYPDMTVRESTWWAKKEGVRLESCQVHAGG